MLFVYHDDGSGLHALGDDLEETLQILEPAKCSDRDDNNIECFFVAVIYIIDIDRDKFAREL